MDDDGQLQRHQPDQQFEPDPVHATCRRSDAAVELQDTDGGKLHGPGRHARAQHVSRRRRLAFGQAHHQRRQRDRQFLLAHHQCGRPRRRDGGEWHPGGAGDQRRHDGARRLRARYAVEVRGGAFDYCLFRGGLDGSSPNDWFLRSTFIIPTGADRTAGAVGAARADRAVAADRSATGGAAAGCLSDHRAGDRDLRRGPADRPAIGDDDARHLA